MTEIISTTMMVAGLRVGRTFAGETKTLHIVKSNAIIFRIAHLKLAFLRNNNCEATLGRNFWRFGNRCVTVATYGFFCSDTAGILAHFDNQQMLTSFLSGVRSDHPSLQMLYALA